jgi:hypothetical protein
MHVEKDWDHAYYAFLGVSSPVLMPIIPEATLPTANEPCVVIGIPTGIYVFQSVCSSSVARPGPLVLPDS